MEDLCKPRLLANRPNFEPIPAFDLRVRAGIFILHPWVLVGELIIFVALST